MFHVSAEHIELSKCYAGQSWFHFVGKTFLLNNNGNFVDASNVSRCISISKCRNKHRDLSRKRKHTQIPLFVHVFRFVLFVVGFSFEAKFIAFINFMILTYSHFVLTRSLLLSRSHSCWAVLHFSLSRGAYIYLIKIWQCSEYTHSHSDTLCIRLLRFPLFFRCFTFLHLHSFSQFRCEAIELTTHKPQ